MPAPRSLAISTSGITKPTQLLVYSLSTILVIASLSVAVICQTGSTVGATPIATGRLIFLSQEISSLGKNLTGFVPSGALADLDKDGKLDLVLIGLDGSDTVTVRLGNGDGTFQAPHTFATGLASTQAVTVADLNGDGKPDLAITGCGATCSRGVVAVLLGNGDGSFKATALYETGGSLSTAAPAVADLNHDGKMDLVVVNATGSGSPAFGDVTILLGRGDGTFQPPTTYSTGGFGSSSVAIAKLNGDDHPDLVVSNDCSRQSCTTYDQSHQIGVLLGNGDGTFQPVVGYPSGGFGTDFVNAIDLNGDGKLDVVAATRCTPKCTLTSGPVSGVAVLLGNGDGTLQPPVSYNTGATLARGLTVIDANGDGKRDLIMTGFCNENTSGCDHALANIFALLGNGDGTFKPGEILYMLGSFGGPETLLTGDLNGDHKPDLLLIHSCNLLNCPVSDFEAGVMFNNRGAPATSISLSSSTSSVPLFQTVTYTAKVSDGSSAALSGTVTFADGADPVKTVNLSASQATYSTTYKTPAIHQITATYSGVLNTNESRRSVVLTENAVAPTKTVLTSSGSPSFVGVPVTFTATVTSKYGSIPAGEIVKFFDGNTLLAPVALSGGKATFTTSTLTARSHAMKAVYAGDSMFATSTGFANQLVQLPATTTTLMSQPNPSSFGQVVTISVTVKSAGPATPTGKVIFTDGTTWIGAASVSGGVASITKSNLASGSHPIRARYSGDSKSAASTSAVVNQVVQ